ncbi:MAG TPA: hypothetical protein VMV19_09335 [Xanthobacteraceae bacterium]|nr:hypothetical protein [Xanthobacteraceae bacterium]
MVAAALVSLSEAGVSAARYSAMARALSFFLYVRLFVCEAAIKICMSRMGRFYNNIAVDPSSKFAQAACREKLTPERMPIGMPQHAAA